MGHIDVVFVVMDDINVFLRCYPRSHRCVYQCFIVKGHIDVLFAVIDHINAFFAVMCHMNGFFAVV